MTIKETLDFGAAFLARKGVESPQVNADTLIAHGLGLPNRLSLYLQFERTLSEDEVLRLRALFMRRGERQPLQHIVGTVQFGSVTLKCDERALIPRPETEMLVEELVRQAGTLSPGTCADIGTGSGAILCAFLAKCPAWHGFGVDVSPAALALAQENVRALGLEGRVRLVAGDLAAPVAPPVEMMAANLPYIPSAQIPGLSLEVQRDPLLALDGGADGLDLVRRLLASVEVAIVPGGMLILELGSEQVPIVIGEMLRAGWQQVRGIEDMAGRARFAVGHRPA